MIFLKRDEKKNCMKCREPFVLDNGSRWYCLKCKGKNKLVMSAAVGKKRKSV